jgi:hypothetical protein
MVLFSFFLSDVGPRGAHEGAFAHARRGWQGSVKKSRGMSHHRFRLRDQTPGSLKAKQLRAFAPNVLC